VALPAFGRRTPLLWRGCCPTAGRAAIDRYLLPTQQQTRRSGVRPPDGIDRQTD